MPASVNDSVTTSLLLSLSTKCGPENKEIRLEQRMAASAKRVLHTTIEYELNSDTYQKSFLQGLKAKYCDYEDGSLKNGLNLNSKSSTNGKGSMEPNSLTLPTPSRILYPMEKVQLHWPSQRSEQGSGFTNAGNSCYLNSVLQALFHIPPMFNWLMEGDKQHQQNCNSYINLSSECIICCMAVTLKQSQQRTGSEVRPHLILSRLRSICKRLIPGQQEDAMEFLRYLFEAMEKSYLQRFSGIKLDSCSKETTPLNQIFGGYIRTEVTCLSCNGVSTTFQHFLDLTLDISRGQTLYQALETYFGSERLEGDNSYRCDKCRRKVPATKQFFIERLPNVLCLQLKRFSIEGKKISKCIQPKENIQLNAFLSRPKAAPGQQVQKSPRGAHYRLQAVVNHHGHTAQSGHYTTMAYAASSTLYHFDDSCVQRIWSPNRGFSGTDAYLLMYVLETKQDYNYNVSLPSASATTTSQSMQSSFNRIPTKPTPIPSFVPLQCRPKPTLSLSQNSNKFMFNKAPNAIGVREPLVSPNKAPAVLSTPPKSSNGNINNPNNKPVNKDGMVAAVNSLKSNVQTSATSPNPAPAKERNVLKVENGKAQDSLSMPTLVPYVEDNVSGDESTSQAAVKRPATPCTNGWTVTPATRVLNNGQENELSKSENTSSKSESSLTDSPKKLTKVTDSPKMLHKINGLDLNTQNRKNSPKAAKDISRKVNKPLFSSNENVTVKRSYDAESSSVAESECSVRSTSSSWQVSPVVTKSSQKEAVNMPTDVLVSAPDPPSATAVWEVTSAPTSAEQSPGPLPSTTPSTASSTQSSHKRKHSRCSRSSSSSSSRDSSTDSTSSSDSNGKALKRQKVWVERTKETIFGSSEDKKTNGLKHPTATKERCPSSNVAEELRKMSHSGYGGSQVSTWHGGRSLVDRSVRDDYYERRREHKKECDYDSDMDGGRRKKMKSDSYYKKDEEHTRVNRFQQESDYRRNSDRYDRQGNWDSRKYSYQYNSQQHRSWHSNQHSRHYNNNNNYSSNRYHNNYHKNYNSGNRYHHGKRHDREYRGSRNRYYNNRQGKT